MANVMNIYNTKGEYSPQELLELHNEAEKLKIKSVGQMLSIAETRIVVASRRVLQEDGFKIVVTKVKKEPKVKIPKEPKVKIPKVRASRKKAVIEEVIEDNVQKLADIVFKIHKGIILTTEEQQFFELQKRIKNGTTT
jgi:hypothetical protein